MSSLICGKEGSTYSLADYRRHYEDCKKSLDLVKEIVKQGALMGPPHSPAIKELRESLVRLFSNSELSQICKKCGGDCCVTYNFCLRPLELFYFVINNPSFELPEPDWQFLEKELKQNKLLINNRCLFSSAQGCLLREHRPMVCLLFYDCDLGFWPDSLKGKLKEIYSSGEREKIFSLQAPRYAEAGEIFCQRIIRAVNLSESSLLASEIKSMLINGVVGYRVCLEILEKLLGICKNRGRS